MLTEKESQDLIQKLISLRNTYELTKSSNDLNVLKKHEDLCIQKFKYLVSMKTAKYKKFSNYEDLNQEGFFALIKSMQNYNPKLGIFFWWAHKYIDTRIARKANLHSTIRYPLKFAKDNMPHKESYMPNVIEEQYCPDKQLEISENLKIIDEAMSLLNDEQKQIVDLFYGLTENKKMSINKICEKLNISRSHCLKTLSASLKIMKSNIKS